MQLSVYLSFLRYILYLCSMVIYTFPIAVYNCEKKEVIGLFDNSVLAARYLYNDTYRSIRIRTALLYKSRTKTKYGRIAVRACNEEQRKVLGSSGFIILNGYPDPISGQMKGFDNLNESPVNKDGIIQKYFIPQFK